MGQPVNVVLICVDQWRGDCLGVEGHPAVLTPFLDELALDGTRFTRAYSSTPTCIAARAALYTGLSQERHGRVGYRDGVPWNYRRTIASEFASHGYQTQAVGKLHVYPERSLMGFHHVELHDGFLHFVRDRRRDAGTVDDYLVWLRERLGPYADYHDHGVDCNSHVARPWDKDESVHPSNWVVHRSIDFLRRRDPTKPFFLYMGFHRPHPPYDPPGWAFDLYRDAPLPPAPSGDWAGDIEQYRQPGRCTGTVTQASERVRRLAQAGYYGHMTHIDHQVRRFLDALREYGVDRDTCVCFTSDHGEMLGDHGMWRKSVPYEGSARVPLLLKTPHARGLPSGNTCDAVAELRDVMPTLLDVAGLPLPESIDGRSLLPFVRGERPAWRQFLHGEHLAFGQSVQWVTDGREKYVWFSTDGTEQLFDLQNDPAECRNLVKVAEAAPRLQRWRARLVEALSGRPEGFVQDGRLVTGAKVGPLIPGVLPA